MDLEVWCPLQARVEDKHFGKHCKVQALARSFTGTWANGQLDKVIEKVFDRLKRVLFLITEAKGINDLVETKLGKKSQDLNLPIDLTMEEDTPDLVPKLLPIDEGEEEFGQEDAV